MTMPALEKNIDSFYTAAEKVTQFLHYLSIAESYGEPSKVSINDLNGGVSGTGDVEHAGVAGNDLLVFLSAWIMDNNI